MVQSQSKTAALALAAALALLAGRVAANPVRLVMAVVAQDASTPPLNPFRLKQAESEAGNPLAGYLEQVRLEKELLAGPMGSSGYWQARATTVSYLGDLQEADRDWDLGVPDPPATTIPKTSPLEGFRATDAVTTILRAADRHRWIMVGEEHVKPQTRSILPALLRGLYKKGFRTLAVETFNVDVAERARQDGYPSLRTGTYTADPVFAAAIREAIRLGFRLVPYEAEERPRDAPKDDPEFAQNFREHLQAQNLKERIYDRDPKARTLVWAGRAHVLETSVKDADGSEWRPMAYEFKRMTGEDPYSVYLATYVEASARRFERPTYKWATDRGLVARPTIFVGPGGKPFGESFDAQVFFPRTVIRYGRPDWLSTELGRTARPIPTELVASTGIQLAQAFRAGEPPTAVPIDQALIRPGEPVPALMLPKGGRYRVRVLDAAGRASDWATL